MLDPKAPSAKDTATQTQVPEKILTFVGELRTNVKTFDIETISSWKDKMRIARNMRQGIKRNTDFPYEGAPDIPLPETDKVIRKHKPRFVLAVISGKKRMEVRVMQGTRNVTTELEEKAKRATLAMNWLFERPRMEWKRKLTLSADRFLEKGHCIFKILEEFVTRMVNKIVDINEFSEEQLAQFKALTRDSKIDFLADRYGLDPDNEDDEKTIERILREFAAGKKTIKFSTEEVTNLPNVDIPPPEKIFVPRGTTNIGKATRVTHEFWWTKETLLGLALSNALVKENVLRVLKTKDSGASGIDDDYNEQVKARLEGVEDEEAKGEMFRIHETVTYFQKDENKPMERWMFTTFGDVESAENALLFWGPYPYEAEDWNYVKHDNEIIDDRYYSSRGTPEQIRAIQEFMERSINNMLIRDEMNNAPMYTVKNTANIVTDTIRFMPGQKINVNSHDDIARLSESSHVDISSERILGTLKAYAEEYVGISDQLFKNAANKGGEKTLGEIQLGMTDAQFPLNLDMLNWIESIRKVYERVFFIMQERLVRPIIINGTEITREDFAFEPDITVNGSLEMADKALQSQRSQLRLERSRTAKADGVATLDDVYNAYEDFFEKDGVKEPGDFITKPAEVAQAKITQMENQVAQLEQLKIDYDSEIAQSENTLRQIQQQIVRKGGANVKSNQKNQQG